MWSTVKSRLVRWGTHSAARNFGWLAIEKLVRLVFGVLVGFWVARYLGPEQFGVYNYVIAIVGIALMVVEGGLEGVVRRELLQQPERSAVLLGVAGAIRLALGLAGYLLFWIAIALGWGNAAERSLFAVMGLLLFQPVLFLPDLWFQARLRSRTTVIVQLVALAIGASLRLAAIRNGCSLVAFAWIAVAEVGCAGLLLVWRARRDKLELAWAGDSPRIARAMWRDAWPLLASGLAVAVYMRIDAVMLRQMLGDRAVGYYAAGTKFTEVWFFFPGALAVSMMPALIQARGQNPRFYAKRLRQYCDLSALLAYGIAIPTAVASPWLIRWAYGPAYASAATVLAIHAWVLVFAALGVARGQFCINEGRTRFHLCATVAGAGINVLLNLWLIPHHGPAGAALATLAAQMVAAWLSSFCFGPIRAMAWMQTRALLMPWGALRHEPGN